MRAVNIENQLYKTKIVCLYFFFISIENYYFIHSFNVYPIFLTRMKLWILFQSYKFREEIKFKAKNIPFQKKKYFYFKIERIVFL
jgi:hypothetical protein